ncbi:MAG: hypothetical protein ABSA26_03645 [Thermoguttaceae bacterium]|jgi:hypothetical protein
MNITQITVHGIIRPDGALELSQPLDLPPGKVQITVQHLEASPQAKENIGTFLERIRANQQARSHIPRTREEIDADLNAMRREAEEEIQEIENIQSSTDKNAH